MNNDNGQGLMNKYVWVIETIYRHRKLSFRDLNELWLNDDISMGVELPKRTFDNWRYAIGDIFKLDIVNGWGWNRDSSDREKFPHGCVWLKKYEDKILDLLRDVTVDDGAEFKRFLEDKLYHTLKEIKEHPNEMTMKTNVTEN